MPTQETLEFDDQKKVPLLFGAHNQNLQHLESILGITIADRGTNLTLSGDKEDIRMATAILNSLWSRLDKYHEIGTAEIDASLRFFEDKESGRNKKDSSADKGAGRKNASDIVIKTRKKTIVPRSPNQSKYVQAIYDHELVFGLGPSGTGKTYLSVAVGISLYLEGKIERLIFCRPAVEAGEHLGFLPGDMKEKVDPYLRPIYDALHDMIHWDFMMKKIEAGDIEIAPLAFMRGRTLSNAFVILDEAQNATPTQLKMFLTRLGESSRMVINGDLTQTDLPSGSLSGLKDATQTLSDVDEIAFCHFENDDIIRHRLVGKIVRAYEKLNKQTN